MMKKQGHEEPTGQAKITPAYNLPADYVIHTVGPIVHGGFLQKRHEKLLESCYRSCLEIAEEHKLESILLHFHRSFHVPKRKSSRDRSKNSTEIQRRNKQ